jgi:hypothetical protein
MWFGSKSDEDEELNVPKCETLGTIAVLWYKAYEADDSEVEEESNVKDLPNDQIEQIHKDGTHHTKLVVCFGIYWFYNLTHMVKNGRGTNSACSFGGPKCQGVRRAFGNVSL